jgi:hypothetical protein
MDMKRRGKAIAGWLVLAMAGSACAQSPGSVAASLDTMRRGAATPEIAHYADGEALQEIEDPSTGNRWLLLRDLNRPAGPGRLVLTRQGNSPWTREGNGAVPLVSAGAGPFIHTGDALLVEEHTPVADTRLEAVALGPAVKGTYFRARLKIGGKVARVMAIAPGRAVFGPESEVEP